MSNEWITTERYGDVFLTHNNIAWLVDKDLQSVCIKLLPDDMKRPITSSYKSSISKRAYDKAYRLARRAKI